MGLWYFIADTHLGLDYKNPEAREKAFAGFLKNLPPQTSQVFLLGDIFDFWYEYKNVIPRRFTRTLGALADLADRGVKISFMNGNHDIWTYSYFEQLGMHRFEQPYYVTLDGKDFCLGHGDLLGGAKRGYKLMIKVFHNRAAQWLFSLLHPWMAYRFGLGWSNSNRRKHKPYHFRGAEEPLYRFAEAAARDRHVDYFVFGHYHDAVDLTLPGGERLFVLKDWMDGGMPCGVFNGSSFELRCPASPAE